MDATQLIYVPYHSFVTQYRAEYEVSIGDIQREPQTIYIGEWENGQWKSKPRTVWRRKTEWRPYLNKGIVSGNFTTKFADQVPRGGEFSTFVNETSWHSDELVPTPSINDGREMLTFSRSAEEAYAEVVRDKLTRKILEQIQEELPGDTFRDLKYQWKLKDNEWTRVYLPYWRFSVEYQGASYVALADGSLVNRISGQLPTDVELRRTVNESLKPLWVALGIGTILAFAIMSIGGSAAVVPWLIALIMIAVSVVGLKSYKNRQETLTDAGSRRTQEANRLLRSLEQGDSVSGTDVNEGRKEI